MGSLFFHIARSSRIESILQDDITYKQKGLTISEKSAKKFLQNLDINSAQAQTTKPMRYIQ